jgi:N-acetylglucosaminyldiphosphoundecaprenol N-acetyl-beta-D-mannosaminyltransferase
MRTIVTRSAGCLMQFNVLGIRVNGIQIHDAVSQIERCIHERSRCQYVAVTGMHGVMEAQHDAVFKDVLNSADLVVPDGMPLVWLGRLRGHSLRRRVYGPELMLSFCEATRDKGYRHFFYGSTPLVIESLAQKLCEGFPGIQIVGIHSPPFRPLTPEEDKEIVAQINKAHADVLWVGLSTPKQELWMHAHRHLLNVPVLVGVGAAFDINAGVKKQAPPWMREHGLEWCFRLLQEPRRLWYRYLVYGSLFVFYASLELAGIRKRS